jgi:hypothetical protein
MRSTDAEGDMSRLPLTWEPIVAAGYKD